MTTPRSERKRAGRLLTKITYATLAGAAIVTFVVPKGLALQPVRASAPPEVIPLAGAMHEFGSSASAWCRDLLGLHPSVPYSIPLIHVGGGLYEFKTARFHPREGDDTATNEAFTFGFTGCFTYASRQKQFVEFEGADDAWIFIDGRLVMDGDDRVPGVAQRVDLDQLGLADGQVHVLQFFYASRPSHETGFRLRTNVVMETSGPTNAADRQKAKS